MSNHISCYTGFGFSPAVDRLIRTNQISEKKLSKDPLEKVNTVYLKLKEKELSQVQIEGEALKIVQKKAEINLDENLSQESLLSADLSEPKESSQSKILKREDLPQPLELKGSVTFFL